MFEKEEEKLVDYKNMYDQVDIPLTSLDDAILSGFQKAKLEEGKKARRRGKKILLSVLTAAILLLGFFTSIRLSPAFAEYITSIPGMEKFVDLIRNDKGKMLAVENDYYQKIDVSQEKNGLKFTIDGMIADENGMFLFYTTKSRQSKKELIIDKVELKGTDGKKLDIGSIAYGNPNYSEKGQNSSNGKLEFTFQSPLKEKRFELILNVKGSHLKESFDLKFQLNKEIQAKKIYKLNKTITIEGQKVTFLDATVYPLRVTVHVKMDPNNKKKLLDFKDLRLVDENGDTFNKIVDGQTGSNISANERIIYLQSNYFREPKHLYLVLNKVQAVDKEDAYLVVETKKQQILKQPKGDYLQDFKIEGDDLIFRMQTKEGFPYSFVGELTDSDGKKVDSSTQYSHGDGQNKVNVYGVTIPNLNKQKSPLFLEITFYPSEIRGDVKVKIK
ncbi:hypothetical protein BIV60_05705 [Bacillus sp. MUM 116]|uniref:DUF4179 domain-containing protein n=1 Tax=Bacillus sp. MUM 116 TaxID=1678002 RepID=UPI0008F5D01B|nr:DUF4179 domain-containing protein [Bacillus sp. MUM 116]OIK16267.1 hypothetical protein BIV60_05705 [Bacillus sp. MUM 116]